ncbi:SRPBCC family protein [Pontimicrobium sp. SW4]|uniref:SRPBCC family protein n=1 Tax=Pontimicrobium sp. SW4 TaxID=3153519 RepID=A0AAU7BPN2_9FLAO
MKTAKVIIIILLIFIIGSCGYIAVQPNSYDIQRSRVIKAPAELLFNQINDFKNWESWSPWVEKEPNLQISYPEQTSGVGGSYSWIGEDGPGNMKTLAVSPFDSISQEMQFDDFPPSNVYWKFDKVDEGTKVTWGMKADEVPFLLKFFAAISGGMDKMVGPDYERGLEKLDSLIIDSMSKFEVTIQGIKEYGGGFYLYKTTNATNENISAIMGEQYGSIHMFMAKKDIQMNGMPLTVYQDMNMDDGTVIMSNGIPVSEKITITDDSSGVLCGYIPKTKVVKTTLKGNYTNLSKAWEETMKYLTDNNIEQSNIKPFEIYTNDPGNFPNPADWITEIYIPIKE